MDEVRIREYAAEHGIDVLLVQEAYTSRGKLVGMPFTATVVLGGDPNNPSPPMAAIVVLTPGLEFTKLTQFCTIHTVVAELAGTSVILVSQYYQFGDKTMPCRAQLTSLMTSVRDREMLVAADCNARSPLWGSPASCRRERLMERVITDFNLVILNEGEQGATCHPRSGAGSHVDVTLCTQGLRSRLNHWRLHQFATLSDHAIITYDMAFWQTAFQRALPRSYVLSKADWEGLKTEIGDQLQSIPTDNPLIKTDEVSRILRGAMDKHIPRTKKRPPGQPAWWQDDLDKQRKEVRTLRRRYVRAKANASRRRWLIRYQAAKGKYAAMIVRCKSESWKGFLETSCPRISGDYRSG